MKKIVLASNNQHKIEEFKKIFSNLQILSMAEIGFCDEIEETGTTFVENSYLKAHAVAEFLKKKHIKATVLADDSGLCVDALGGRPGVYSARYAGQHDDAANRKKLLQELKGVKDRSAHFVCVITKIEPNGDCSYVEGRADGRILTKEMGSNGFGFDPLFYSDELGKTFAEALPDEKNAVSHRAKAIKELKNVLKVEAFPRLSTRDLILAKAQPEDAKAMLKNFWSQADTAKFMLWEPSKTLKEAKERMQKTLNFQKHNFAYFVYEKSSGEPIGIAGLKEEENEVFQDCGIGIGRDYRGKGYGKQILKALIRLAKKLGAKKLVCSCDHENLPSAKMQLACGLKYTHSQNAVREKNGEKFVQDFYEINF